MGRYRNGGEGVRGAELALMNSEDGGKTFNHVFSFYRDDLAIEGEAVFSIEGACLVTGDDGVELYVSSEKNRTFPDPISEYQKPGTGVWSIDVIKAQTVEKLQGAKPQSVLSTMDLAWLHIKDPVVFDISGTRNMIFCSSPFCWTSANTGYAQLSDKEHWYVIDWSILPRGPIWDVALFRVTSRFTLPSTGVLADRPPISVYFYDGAECLHKHEGRRPWGYACEEVGGLAAGLEGEFPRIERLSTEKPLFMSPYGTGSSRYVNIFDAGDEYIVIWQQSQSDCSQPLVINRVQKRDVVSILSS